MFAIMAQESIAGLGMNARLRAAIGVWVLGWAGSAVFAIMLTLAVAALIFIGLRAWRRNHDKNIHPAKTQELRP